MLVLNLSEATGRGKGLVCREQGFNSKGFKLYVQCEDRGKAKVEHVTIMVNLDRDANSIVNSLIYIREFALEDSNELSKCERIKILYAN